MKLENIKKTIQQSKESDDFKEATIKFITTLSKFKKKDTLETLSMRDIAKNIKLEYKLTNIALHVLNKYGIRPFNPKYFVNDVEVFKIGTDYVDTDTGELFTREDCSIMYSISNLGKSL